MLKLEGVETFYGTSQILFGLSLEVRAGECVTLMGRNGMGKTTTVRSITGLTPAARGSIRFQEREIRELRSYRIARLGIGLVPEGRQIFPNLSVRENLVATARRRPQHSPWTLERVYDLFPRLAERASSMGNQLSGGEQQMLAIGRALMASPRLLLLDEPSLGLAPRLVQEIFRTIQEVNRRGVSVLLVEQNARQALRIADEAYVIETGRISVSGTAAELQGNEEVRKAYLGQARK